MVKNSKSANAQTVRTEYTVEVSDVKEIAGKADSYRFTLRVNGVTLYGMKDIAYTNADGQPDSFIAFSGYKGNNEKFYNNAWFPISRELKEEIEKQIEALLA